MNKKIDTTTILENCQTASKSILNAFFMTQNNSPELICNDVE